MCMQIRHTIRTVLLYLFTRGESICYKHRFIFIRFRKVGQYIPTCRFASRSGRARILPVLEVHIGYYVILVIIPNFVRIGTSTIGHFRFPVFGGLLQDIDLGTLVEGVAENRFVRHFDDIGEVLGIKSGDGYIVHFDVRQDSRISGRHRRNDTIDLIGYRVVVGFDGNDRRSVDSTRLDEDGLLGVHLLIRNGQRTRTERHLHIEIALVFVFQTQILVQLQNMDCSKDVAGFEDRALE